jgi:hypothetical protein
MSTKIERRFLPATEVRAIGDWDDYDPDDFGTDDGPSLDGYAATFGTISEDLGGFRECLSPGCFSRALREKQDVIANINHSREPERILGRCCAGTLQLKEDNRGLHFRCALPQTQAARDAHAQVRAGNISGCSFAFMPVLQDWNHNWAHNGEQCSLRTVRDCDLFDVSPVVTDPAYPNTSVDARAIKLYFPDGVPVEVRAHVPGIDAITEVIRSNRRKTTGQVIGW